MLQVLFENIGLIATKSKFEQLVTLNYEQYEKKKKKNFQSLLKMNIYERTSVTRSQFYTKVNKLKIKETYVSIIYSPLYKGYWISISRHAGNCYFLSFSQR